MKNTEQRGWLVVTVDTEEEGLWSGNYSSRATVKNIAAIPRFQTLCDRFSIRPTYLITTPVAESSNAVDTLRTIQDDGRCEIGSHVHPWNSPPITSKNSAARDSFLCNLPEEIQRAKLEQLTETIDRNFGRRPVSFRAGRYGMDATGIKILRDLGYLVDSSVLPRADYRNEGGPDFRGATCQPFFPSSENILDHSTDETLLEIPVTAGFTHRYFEIADRLRRQAMRSPWRQMRAVGILDRAGIATKVKLSPEQSTLNQMKRLARAVSNRGVPVLVLMFHSSSLLPGCSPYVKDQKDLESFLNRLDCFFDFALNDIQMAPVSLADCYGLRHQLSCV